MQLNYIFDAVESHHGEFKYGVRIGGIRIIRYHLIRESEARPFFFAVVRLNSLKYILSMQILILYMLL